MFINAEFREEICYEYGKSLKNGQLIRFSDTFYCELGDIRRDFG
jgi:hypothetical protein